MKKQDRIIKSLDKKLLSVIEKQDWYSVDNFISDGQRWIKAIESGRMICSIGSVSKSGMSRTMKFCEMSKNKYSKRYGLLNFYAFMSILGFQKVGDSSYFRIHGCGMDMVFATNYIIIRTLYSYKFINIKQCLTLEQLTPEVM